MRNLDNLMVKFVSDETDDNITYYSQILYYGIDGFTKEHPCRCDLDTLLEMLVYEIKERDDIIYNKKIIYEM